MATQGRLSICSGFIANAPSSDILFFHLLIESVALQAPDMPSELLFSFCQG